MEPTYTWFAGSGRLTLTLTMDQAQSCSHPGPCDADVEWMADRLADQTDKWSPGTLAAELRGYGAWDDDELADHGANVQRMVWIACNDVADDPDCYRDEV